MTEHRSALVTGASRGIGRAIAHRLAARGYALTIVARHADGLATVADELTTAGAPAVAPHAADLSDTDTAVDPIRAHKDRFGTMHALVLNAGMGDRGLIAEQPVRRFDRIFAVNVRAPYLMLQAATPLLRQGATEDPRRGAKVIALASSVGVFTEPGYGSYGSSKAALINLVETYALEESGNGISATTLSPGYVETDMTDWLPTHLADTLLSVEDVATMADAVISLSPNAVVKNVTLTRAGSSGHQA